MFRKSFSLASILGVCLFVTGNAQVASNTEAPAGFDSLFNGQNLDGWYASPTADPAKFAALSEEDQQAKIAELEKTTGEAWRVEEGQIINEGKGPYLTTKREFRDFELMIDFKLEAEGDLSLIHISEPTRPY